MAYKLRQRQSLKAIHKLAFVAGGVSVLALAAYITIVINGTQVENSHAGNLLMSADNSDNNQVITAFNFNDATSMEAESGLNYSSINSQAHIVPDGVNNTGGLSAGRKLTGLNMEFSACDQLNADGLDISMDVRRIENDGNFYTRGKSFNFGMKDGKIIIRYRLLASNGKSYSVDEATNYVLAEDGEFRNVRFIYTPATGKGEVLVNNITVWSNRAPENFRLAWHGKDKVIIGEDLDGGGTDKAVLDNISIKQTGKANNSPVELLSFSADMNGKDVDITWNTKKEIGTEDFIIEKSYDTKTFSETGRVKGAGFSDVVKSYSLTDMSPTPGVTFYRLALSNHRAKSVWMPVVAIRVNPQLLPGSTVSSNTLPEPK